MGSASSSATEASHFDNADLGLIVEDAVSEIYLFSAEDCRFLLVNRGARENLGYTMGELSTMTPWDIKPEVPEKLFHEMIQPLLEGTERKLDFETIHRRRDGSDYRVAVRLQLVTVGDRKVFFAAIQDVTARHEMTEELRRKSKELEDALRMKDLLLHEVNHRVKNSLQTVSSLLQMQAGLAQDAPLAFSLNEAQRRIEVISKIHHSLYTTHRHNQMDFSAYLAALARNIVDGHKGEAEVTLSLAIAPTIFLNLDKAVPLALIASEIMTNALKYAFVGRDSGTLSLSLETADSGIILRIRDDGIGFPGELGQTERVGVGSRIIRGLTTRLGGTVEVADAQPGALFAIALPA